MAENSKHKQLLITLLLTLLLVPSAYATLRPTVHAAEITVREKGLAILKDVVGLDTAGYAVNAKEYPQESYWGVLPQETVRYELNSDGSNIEILHTFVNGKLLMLDVLENQGSPRLTKTVTSVAEMAKNFLSSYQSYSGNTLYGELRSSLVGIDPSRNSTKTVGKTKLEVSTLRNNFTDRQVFRWTYTLNGVEAPDKVVALGYENGFLGYFYDSWDLYKIGSTSVNVSEEEAIASAMERAKNYSWSIEANNGTAIVKDFNVTGAMMWETVFRSSLVADKPRNEDKLMLYPMRHVWVSLDKFYPGNVYGFNVYVWADTGEIAHIHERICTQDPPSELVASADDFTVILLNSQTSFDNSATVSSDQLSSAKANSNSSLIMWITLSVFAVVVMLGGVKIVLARKKGLQMRQFSKIGGLLLCLLLFSMLMATITSVDASYPQGRATIWTSRSLDAYNYTLGFSWRKHYNEVAKQDETAASIWSSFGSNNYYASDYHGSSYNGAKERILTYISENEALYPRVAVVVFDHGNGITGLDALPSNEFHYLFEDDAGTYEGQMYPGSGPNQEHAVFDMNLYPRTALGKVFFSFINTCNSAHVSDYLGSSYAEQGIILGTDRARGMPFAFTHLRPNIDMSSQGYWGDVSQSNFCYIGFEGGSAALQQSIEGSCPAYYQWVEHFFAYALTYDMSVSDALDQASTICWPGYEWWETPLYQGFTSSWPMYTYNTNTGHEDWHDIYPPEMREGSMKVYGNGNIRLYQKGGIWHLDGNAIDDLHDNDGTVHGATWTYPKFGSHALYFDGNDDYVNIPDHSDLDITNAVTVEAWIRPSRLNVWQSPLEKGAHNDWAYGFYIEPAGGNIGFEIGLEGQAVQWAGATAPVNSYLAVNKWSHLVGTADSATGKVCLYIDGRKVAENTFSGQINTNSIPFQIGKRSDGGYFGGIIDEVRIYDRALSASEIASIYAANKPVHWLTVSMNIGPYGSASIDGVWYYCPATVSVLRGLHTIEVGQYLYPYPGIQFRFDHYTYDSTTDYNNPMTLTVSKDTAVTAYYVYG